jgi:parvulin-like peptidyl-prolyl isomerase
VAPNQGGRRTLGKGGSESASGPAAVRRLGLLIFGIGFILLFAIVAIAEGVGDPSIPSGDVALIEGAPDGSGEITEAKFDHALEQSAVAGGLEKVPKPGDNQYEELKEGALKALFEAVWIQGLAEEQGVTASDKELDEGLQKAIAESFGGSKEEFNKYLKEAHYTQVDVDEKVKLQVLAGKLQEDIGKEAPQPSEDEVEDYYEAAKASQFKQAETRDVRSIVNQEREKAEKALARLEKDNSPEAWDRAAKEFSEDAATMQKGGLQANVSEEFLGEPLKAAVFDAPEGRLEGPLKAPNGFIVFEVVGSTPESFQELEAVEGSIESTLAQRNEQDFFAAFLADYQLTWSSRTFCAPGYVTESCANFKLSGHPLTAPASCYEADPKSGPPEDCPAPVFQLIPALPGSVSPLEPQGKPLAQRPQPVPSEQSEEAGAPPPPSEIRTE